MNFWNVAQVWKLAVENKTVVENVPHNQHQYHNHLHTLTKGRLRWANLRLPSVQVAQRQVRRNNLVHSFQSRCSLALPRRLTVGNKTVPTIYETRSSRMTSEKQNVAHTPP
jgi:hypothetical protein